MEKTHGILALLPYITDDLNVMSRVHTGNKLQIRYNSYLEMPFPIVTLQDHIAMAADHLVHTLETHLPCHHLREYLLKILHCKS